MGGAHKSWVNTFCILAPSIFSIAIEGFTLHTKRVSAHMHHT
jgi:hypothetical protein